MCIHLISVNSPAILGHLVTSKPVAESVKQVLPGKTLTLSDHSSQPSCRCLLHIFIYYFVICSYILCGSSLNKRRIALINILKMKENEMKASQKHQNLKG